MNFTQLSIQCKTFIVFRNIIQKKGFKHLQCLLNYKEISREKWLDNYCELCIELFDYNMNLSNYILAMTLEDTNVCVLKTAQNIGLHDEVKKAMVRELQILEKLSQIDSSLFLTHCDYSEPLIKWDVIAIDFVSTYQEKLNALTRKGHGIFAKEMAFQVKDNELIAVRNIDKQSLASLSGYEKERSKVIQNTQAFMEGKKASNVLLYGDAGTGKSSTIKAVFNAYKSEGLRLVEVKKSELYMLSDVIEQLAMNPLKFILFIDDLSFSKIDDNFIALKNVLEGGIVGSASNVLIYASSNRRHFVKESLQDRNQDELFTNDSIQETMSLASRFGLTITFQKPGKDLYLQIVDDLAKQYDLHINQEELHTRAEAYAIRSSGRSPRVAKQFVEWEKINQ